MVKGKDTVHLQSTAFVHTQLTAALSSQTGPVFSLGHSSSSPCSLTLMHVTIVCHH